MKYNQVAEGVFIERPNRFVAKVTIDGITETVHVKNTGRCRELLIPGSRVFLSKATNPNRKTAYDLIAVYKEDALGIKGGEPLLVNIDSQATNTVFEEYVEAGHFLPKVLKIKREATYGDSRLDFYIETGDKKIYVEIKGATLEESGKTMFPDAPTQRGIKHINELIRAVEAGFDAYIVFVIQMKGTHSFSPNRKMHPQFADALKVAHEAGVNILALECVVTPDSLAINTEAKNIPIIL
jgi:sugar fermentation stimulation protein A